MIQHDASYCAAAVGLDSTTVIQTENFLNENCEVIGTYGITVKGISDGLEKLTERLYRQPKTILGGILRTSNQLSNKFNEIALIKDKRKMAYIIFCY